MTSFKNKFYFLKKTKNKTPCHLASTSHSIHNREALVFIRHESGNKTLGMKLLDIWPIVSTTEELQSEERKKEALVYGHKWREMIVIGFSLGALENFSTKTERMVSDKETSEHISVTLMASKASCKRFVFICACKITQTPFDVVYRLCFCIWCPHIFISSLLSS